MSQSSPSATIPSLDLDGFRLAMRAAGIEELVEPTLAVFLTESEKLLGAMQEALSQRDTDTLRRAAHTLKGAAGNVHARSLAKVAESMEEVAEHEDFAAAASLCETALHERAQVVRFLGEHGVRA